MSSATPNSADPLCDADAFVVGVEIRPAIIRAGVFAPDRSLLGKTKISTKLERGPEVVIDRIAKCIRYAVDECDVEISQICRVGVAAPGRIVDDSIVANASELGWVNVPLRAHLSSHFDRPVAVGQFFNVAALGIQGTELRHPTLRFGAIFIGPKLGGAVRIGNEWQDLTSLAESSAGNEEAGHQIIAALPHALFSQYRGRDFRKALKKSENTAVRAYVSELAVLAGESAARIHQAFALETIVLGGSLMDEMKDEIMATAREAFDRRTHGDRRQTCALHASELGDLAAITGAALWSRRHCSTPEPDLMTNA